MSSLSQRLLAAPLLGTRNPKNSGEALVVVSVIVLHMSLVPGMFEVGAPKQWCDFFLRASTVRKEEQVKALW